jgi:hypothetical protein
MTIYLKGHNAVKTTKMIFTAKGLNMKHIMNTLLEPRIDKKCIKLRINNNSICK